MKISLIAARSENGVIGRNQGLAWHVKGDLQFFKRMTLGKPIIFGRKTFESMEKLFGKPLPNRSNIILTRDKSYKYDGVPVYQTLKGCIDKACEIAGKDGLDEIFIGGGAEIYKLGLDVANTIYLTEVHCNIEDGDAYFPEIDKDKWKIETSNHFKKADGDTADYTINTWIKS